MRQNRQETRAELFGVLSDVEGVKAFQYPKQVTDTGPIACIENQGFRFDAEEHYWPVRIYLRASDPSAEEAQAALDIAVDAVVAACEAESYICTGSDQYIQEMDLWQADILVDVPRQ